MTLSTHHGSPDLTETDAVSPSATMQDELAALLLYVEAAALQVGGGEYPSNLQFLADGVVPLRALDAQFPDASALAALDRDKVLDGADVNIQLLL